MLFVICVANRYIETNDINNAKNVNKDKDKDKDDKLYKLDVEPMQDDHDILSSQLEPKSKIAIEKMYFTSEPSKDESVYV